MSTCRDVKIQDPEIVFQRAAHMKNWTKGDMPSCRRGEPPVSGGNRQLDTPQSNRRKYAIAPHGKIDTFDGTLNGTRQRLRSNLPKLA